MAGGSTGEATLPLWIRAPSLWVARQNALGRFCVCLSLSPPPPPSLAPSLAPPRARSLSTLSLSRARARRALSRVCARTISRVRSQDARPTRQGSHLSALHMHAAYEPFDHVFISQFLSLRNNMDRPRWTTLLRRLRASGVGPASLTHTRTPLT